ALPEATPAALAYFQARAFVFVTGTRASWTYDAPGSTVNARFDFDTVVKEGTATTPIIALYRHQWLNTPITYTPYTYASARGLMKVAEASGFTSNFPFRGLVPKIPSVGTVLSDNNVPALLNAEMQTPSLAGANDTYGAGRNYGKICQLLHLADTLGNQPAKSRYLTFLKDELQEWYSIGAVGGGRSAFEPIQAESFNDSFNISTGPVPGGTGVTGVTGGSWIKYSGVDFQHVVPNRLLIQYSSTSVGSGSLQVRIGSLTGPIIAGGGVGGTGGAWQEIALGMAGGAAGLSGVQDVYITVSTPYAGELFRFDSFRFDRAGAPADRYFAYHPAWSTLIGYPSSYGSAGELNDHHFHYGYFIYAAATVAQYDPAWAAQYGPMTELLIRDAANFERTDTRFPYLRNFDPYAGHSYASGHAGFYAGNNQESSSEAMNFANGVALWGAVTGNQTIRDLGLYLYASEAAAIQQYWFDADNAVFPPTAAKKISGILWDSGSAYGTFFGANPEFIHGISFLPITPGTLYLGWRPDGTLKSYNQMVTSLGGQPTIWRSVVWSALALA
ncbi:MAG: carbohydrate-binding protein, partial [Phycisphaerales bacterium]|nr:carbohydrate-binding protein [Phycisphaerales bacterium]